MKILLVTTVFPTPLQPNKGAFNREMVRALGNSCEIQVIAPVAWPLVYRAQRAGRAWERVRRADGVVVRHPVYYYPPKVLRSGYGAFFRWSIRATVDELLREFQPDIVMGYWAHPDGQAAVHIASRLGVPSVVMVGGTDVLVLGHGAGRRRAIRRVLERADAIVTVSQDLRRTVREWNLSASKIHVVRRGVDAVHFKPGAREDARRRLGIDLSSRALLWVGHMVAVKGLEVLIDACKQAASRTSFHLYLVGDGPLSRQLQRQCARLGIADRVTFVGYVPHATLPDWYSAADLTVLPSHSEGVPNVLLESIAAGTPFVATRVGGIPEIADPALDRLVAPGDAAAMADAIVDGLSMPGRAERRTLSTRTVDEAAQEMLELLDATIDTQRQAAPAGEASIGAGTVVGVR